MKKLFVLSLLILLAMAYCPVSAQTAAKTGDPTSYMTPEQLAKYQADIQAAELDKKLETYGKWVGVGGEIGEAVREGLSAVGDVANDFGKSEVGKFTMFLVAWKVIGSEIMRIVIGIIFFIFMTFIFLIVYRNMYMGKNVLVENENPGFMKYPKLKKYKYVTPDNGWDGYVAVKILMMGIYLAIIGITYGIMF